MAVDLIFEYSTRVRSEDGTIYIVRTYGEERGDGTWTGWVEFQPTENEKPVLRTGEETSQPNRNAVVYWATGLEPVYFEGAFARASGIDIRRVTSLLSKKSRARKSRAGQRTPRKR